MKIYYILFIYLISNLTSEAQNITYSKLEPFSNWDIPPKIEIIGKIQNNLFIHFFDKKHYIKIYDNEMKKIKETSLGFIPHDVTEVKFIKYPDYCYILWEKIKEQNTIYEFARVNSIGEIEGGIETLDTVNFKIQSDENITIKKSELTLSEDKSKIVIYKVGIKKDTIEITSKVFDAELNILENSTIKLSDYDKEIDFFSDFLISNNGDIIFSRSISSMGKLSFFQVFYKEIKTKELYNIVLPIEKNSLLDPSITIDNKNEEYLINAYQIDVNKNYINGLFFPKISFAQLKKKISKETNNTIFVSNILFDKSLEKKLIHSSKIFMKEDGSFLFVSESAKNQIYTSNTQSYSGQSKLQDGFYDKYSNVQDDIYTWNYNGAFTKSISNNWINRPLPSINPTMYSPTYNQLSIDSLYSGSKNIIIYNIDKNGISQSDTVLQIAKFMKLKKHLTTFPTDYFINWVAIMKENTHINFVTFTKNLNEQLLLTKFKIANNGSHLIKEIIKAKSKDYFFDLKFSKQINDDELIIPFFLYNKIGFAKVN